MIYKKLSTATLKDFHSSIQKCLKEDDSTPSGHMKPYGVREYGDWAAHLQKIEAALTERQEQFAPIILTNAGAAPRPTPIEAVLYERIKYCLTQEDNLPHGTEKPYGVRDHRDWREQADSFEKILDQSGYPYSKIVW
jgi:hypothetical protein